MVMKEFSYMFPSGDIYAFPKANPIMKINALSTALYSLIPGTQVILLW